MKIVQCYWLIDNSCGACPPDDKGLEELPLNLKRKLTPLGRKALQVVNTCAAGLDNPAIPWIISCRHGDKSRRFNLLSSLAKGEMLSPSDFSLSVHNALIGLFSIATNNRHAHGALAGGRSSFEMGLLETIALLKEKGGTVGYIYYDYLVVEKLTDRFEDNTPVECLAMIISDSKGEMTIEYKKNNHVNSSNPFDVKKLLDYLNNDERKYSIPVGGGEIVFERPFSKA